MIWPAAWPPLAFALTHDSLWRLIFVPDAHDLKSRECPKLALRRVYSGASGGRIVFLGCPVASGACYLDHDFHGVHSLPRGRIADEPRGATRAPRLRLSGARLVARQSEQSTARQGKGLTSDDARRVAGTEQPLCICGTVCRQSRKWRQSTPRGEARPLHSVESHQPLRVLPRMCSGRDEQPISPD